MSQGDFAGIVLVLLAAGRGDRFGGSKLSALLAGKPLARHAADMLATFPFTRHIAVTSTNTPDLPGYETIVLDPPGAPQSRSLALGIGAADHARAVLVALADMPLVPAEHIAALVAGFDGDRICSRAGDVAMPPAIFGTVHFPALMALQGDRGAGALLRDAPAIALPEFAALDIDRPEDLEQAERLFATHTLRGSQ